MKNDYNKKRKVYLRTLGTFYYFLYKDYSIDQLNSRLLELYQRKDPFDFFEISFLELLIEIRSSDII